MLADLERPLAQIFPFYSTMNTPVAEKYTNWLPGNKQASECASLPYAGILNCLLSGQSKECYQQMSDVAWATAAPSR